MAMIYKCKLGRDKRKNGDKIYRIKCMKLKVSLTHIIQIFYYR